MLVVIYTPQLTSYYTDFFTDVNKQVIELTYLAFLSSTIFCAMLGGTSS